MSLVRGRRVEDEADARACLAALAASGSTTLNAWCRSNGVSASGLYHWKRKLEAPPKPGAVRLVEVPLPRCAPARYALVLGDVQVVVGDDFRDETLARLLAVVRSC